MYTRESIIMMDSLTITFDMQTSRIFQHVDGDEPVRNLDGFLVIVIEMLHSALFVDAAFVDAQRIP